MRAIDALQEKFGDKIELHVKSERRVYMSVPASEVKEIVTYMFTFLGARLMTISSIDSRAGIELLYHMMVEEGKVVLTVRALVRKPELKIASITPVIEGAEWIEREIHEMMGVDFEGHPNMKRLLLPDDWKEGDLPYRKQSFDGEKEGIER
jgi:NADH-quinone oxidoreductase subunit C